MTKFFTDSAENSTPLTLVTKASLSDWLNGQDQRVQTHVQSQGFKGDAGHFLIIPNQEGKASMVLIGHEDDDTLYALSAAAGQLPVGTYSLKADAIGAEKATQLALGWALGQYKFDRYLKDSSSSARQLAWPEQADRNYVLAALEATTLVRDLVNIPANDLGPEELSDAATKLAKEYGAEKAADIVGTDLLDKNYPLVYAVGKGSDRAPRLIDFRWGNADAPKVTLVGKGVVFDTGGNNIKPGGSMGIMKKDMGGSAHVLGLATMIMKIGLNVRLRVLVPAVENSINGLAMRPGDVYPSRKGLSVEIENTDAEGRLILADALAEAASENPELIIDFATLTGAARVALGPDVPPFFTDSDDLAKKLMSASANQQDPLWQLPLLDELYSKMRGHNIADICHTGGRQGGAITAALFLKKFVDDSQKWIHIDTWAWRAEDRPGRPVGGDAIGMRSVYQMLAKAYG